MNLENLDRKDLKKLRRWAAANPATANKDRMTPQQKLMLYRVAVIVQCVVIFGLIRTTGSQRRSIQESGEALKQNSEAIRQIVTTYSDINDRIAEASNSVFQAHRLMTVPTNDSLLFWSTDGGVAEWVTPDRRAFVMNWIKTNWTDKAKP